MNIELARTFLDVIRTGSFMAAAEHRHVTQTTVTTRIHSLELQLKCRLFIRNRLGATLTEDGERFVSFANDLVHTWESACRNFPLSPGFGDLLAYGGEASLYTPIILNWSFRLKEEIPAHAIHIEVSDGQILQEKIEQGLLDAALVYHPEYRPGMEADQLMEDSLVQIASVVQAEPYIYVDWGPVFRRQHDDALPELTHRTSSFNLGPLALQYILEKGGAGYFRSRVVQPYIEQGLLKKVENAPEFSYPVFLVYSKSRETPAMHQAFEILRDVIKDESDESNTSNIKPAWYI